MQSIYNIKVQGISSEFVWIYLAHKSSETENNFSIPDFSNNVQYMEIHLIPQNSIKIPSWLFEVCVKQVACKIKSLKIYNIKIQENSSEFGINMIYSLKLLISTERFFFNTSESSNDPLSVISVIESIISCDL